MVKFFTIVVSLFVCSPVFSASNSCFEGIVEAEELFRGQSTEQIECIERTETTKESLKGLCSSDQKQFSSIYKAYLTYDAKYKEAEKALEHAWNDEATKNIALINLRMIDSEWKAIGFKNEVISLIFLLAQAKWNCKGHR